MITKAVNIGEKFNMLTFICESEPKFYGRNRSRVKMSLFRCDCGNVVTRIKANVLNGKVRSCGCTSKTKLKDLTGMKFGRLTVIERDFSRSDMSNKKGTYWRCRCDCGKYTSVLSYNLTENRQVSCGCYMNEILAIARSKRKSKESIGDITRTHGESKTRLYAVWCAMKSRTTNPNNRSYHNYGGRGIVMCEEWFNDYTVFRDWAYKNGYDDKAEYGKCTIDRINNDDGYYPENCRLADMKQQAMNRRTTKKLKNAE